MCLRNGGNRLNDGLDRPSYRCGLDVPLQTGGSVLQLASRMSLHCVLPHQCDMLASQFRAVQPFYPSWDLHDRSAFILVCTLIYKLRFGFENGEEKWEGATESNRKLLDTS